jgi:hypothetical protein
MLDAIVDWIVRNAPEPNRAHARDAVIIILGTLISQRASETGRPPMLVCRLYVRGVD